MIRNVLVLFSGNIATQILSFLSGLIVIKMLTVQQYGEYSSITSLVNMLVLPLAGFFSLALRRYIPLYLKQGERSLISGLLRVSLIYDLALAILFPSAIFVLSDWIAQRVLHTEHPEYIRIYAIAVPFLILVSPLSALMLGLEKFREYTYAVNVFPNAARIVHLLLWWLFLPYQMAGALLSFLTKAATNLFLSLRFVKDELLRSLSTEPRYRTGEWVRFSLPNALRFVVAHASQNIGVVLLGSMRTHIDAGIFKASSILIMGVHSVTLAFSSALLPRLSKEMASGDGMDTTRRVSLMNLVAASIMIFPFILAGDFVLGLLGSEYIRGYPVLLIMSLMLLLEAWTSSWQGYIIARGRTDLNLITYSVSSTSSILASYLLIRGVGLYGAAWAIVVESVLNALLRGLWVKTLSGKIPVDFRHILLIASMMLLILFRIWRTGAF